VALTGKQRRYLRALAHALQPVVQVGQRGANAGVVRQVDQALTDHELIKVKLTRECPTARDATGAELASATGAEVAGTVGRVIVLYRARPGQPTIRLPGASEGAEGRA
jgi:RNA-binding protein